MKAEEKAKPQAEPQEQLTLQEAAKELHLSEITTRRWILSGKLSASKPGLRYLVPREAVEELLKPIEIPRALEATPEEFAEMVTRADDDTLVTMKQELHEHLPKGGALPLPIPTPPELKALDRSILIYQEQKRRLKAAEEDLQQLAKAVGS
jgi:excisionase family DNA binding protein